MSKIKTIKDRFKNTSWADVDCFSKIALRVVGILFLLFLAASLLSIKQQYAHSGPNCDDYEESFQYWLSDNGKNKDKILTIETSRVQLKNGTTSCHGKYKKGTGQFGDWSSNITLLDSGDIIGYVEK